MFYFIFSKRLAVKGATPRPAPPLVEEYSRELVANGSVHPRMTVNFSFGVT